jgi:ribosomal protein S20
MSQTLNLMKSCNQKIKNTERNEANDTLAEAKPEMVESAQQVFFCKN